MAKELNTIVKEYLDANGITHRHFAKCIGVDYAVCAKWFNGTRKLNAEKLHKVHKFLHGDYMKSIQEISEQEV